MRGSTHIKVLHLLRKSRGMSRADLARELEVSTGAITKATTPMLAAGWVKEDAEKIPASGKGKPATMLRLNPRAFCSLGIYIDKTVDIVLLDAVGTVLEKVHLPNLLVDDCERGQKLILDEAVKLSRKKSGILLGAAIVCCGLLSQNGGRFEQISNYVRNPDIICGLQKELGRLLSIDVFIDKVESVVILPELYSCQHNSSSPSLCLITEELELSATVNGRVMSVPYSSNSSISHLKTRCQDKCVICGETGCLVMAAGLWVMGDRLADGQPGTRGYVSREEAALEIDRLRQRMRQRDPAVCELYTRGAEAMADAAESIILLMQPEILFLPDWLGDIPELGIELIRKKLERNTGLDISFDSNSVKGARKRTRISFITHGELQAAIGAGMLVLEKFLGGEIPQSLRIGKLLEMDGAEDIKLYGSLAV